MFHTKAKPDLELALRHDGTQWSAEAGAFHVSGRTLSELEARLRDQLRQHYPPHARITVLMGFDNETMPPWLRQYMAHYFNRMITFDL